jgi:hypothetical protein
VSFLIDPPWLFANGEAYARVAPDSAQGPAAKILGTGTVALFWVTSISLYLNRDWTRGIWEACGAADGRDWMLNSGVFRFDATRAGPRTHALAALLFATYPLWLWLGYRHGRRAGPTGA